MELIQQAMERNTLHPPQTWGTWRAYYTSQRYTEAILATRHIKNLDILQIAFLTDSHAYCEDQTQAEFCIEMAASRRRTRHK